MTTANQTPEQIARDQIDALLQQAGWVLQSFSELNPNASLGVAVREYQTSTGPVDYALFVDAQLCGVVEAKREDLGFKLHSVAEQSQRYASSEFKFIAPGTAVHFLYESTGTVTHFSDARDPNPRSREVFNFHRPETLQSWLQVPPLRHRLQNIPALDSKNLRDCQITAVTNLEASFKQNKPRALIQMATGAGKTYTAVTSIYRLLKHAGAKRILFLVDTKNLGEQAEQEFMTYVPTDDTRKFTELYTVNRLKSAHVPTDAQVVICTIQRLYAMLKGEELEDSAEDINPNELKLGRKEPLPVVYNATVPLEFFDFIVIDECHRSIYNLWRQVLEYFDGFLIGLTATPDSRTYGFFQQNVVSEYTHEQAVVDGVNVAGEEYIIRTKITEQGAKVERGHYKRHKLTRKQRWDSNDEVEYQGKELDRSVVNESQIRTVLRSYRQALPDIFPQRPTEGEGPQRSLKTIPKTLIFAKTDSHADDIINLVRQEFNAGNDFCKKVTYQSKEDPKSVLNSFRNDYMPRIAVTVDMIATGTDVKPLECLLFMRDVKSKNYYEQMKGRGTRVADSEAMKRACGEDAQAKTHYVLIDAVGVTESIKTDNRPLETKPSVSTKDLLTGVMMGGARDDDSIASAAGRLARIDRQLNQQQKHQIEQTLAENGHPDCSVQTIAKGLLAAIEPDQIEQAILQNPDRQNSGTITSLEIEQTRKQLIEAAVKPLSMPVIELITDIQRQHEQTLDEHNLDEVLESGWKTSVTEKQQATVSEFEQYLQSHRDDITALSLFYSQPQRRKNLSFKMIKGLLQTLKSERPHLAPLRIWDAYAQLDQLSSKTAPEKELAVLVSLVRRACGIDQTLNPYSDTVEKRFADWVWRKQQGDGPKFSEEQMHWLRMVRDHIAHSFHFERDDCELEPFNQHGGLGGFYQRFGEQMDAVIDELNEALVA